MADDNVVKGHFGKKKPTPTSGGDASERHSLGAMLEKVREGPLGDLLKETGIVTTSYRVLLQEYFDSLKEYTPNHALIRDQELLLRESTDEELQLLLQNGKKPDWQRKPAYYQALLNVCRNRNI